MKDTICTHHSGISGDASQYDDIAASHRKRFGKNQAPAYHFVIEKNGIVKQAHPEDFTGHHSGKWLMNVRSIGICVAGNFTKEKPTSNQIDALTKLVTDLQLRYGISDDRIIGHRDVKPTKCPAIDFRPLIKERRLSLLNTRIELIQRAIPKAQGSRKNRLTRALERLLQLLSTLKSS